MINFAKVKNLEIPEGAVSKIAFSNGRVLWSAVQNVTVTLTATTYMLNAEMTTNGETYILNTYTETPEVLTLPVGTHLVFTNTNTRVNGDVYINHADGTKTTGSFSKNGGIYAYTVIGNTEVKASNTYKSYGPSAYDYAPVITITEQ